MRTPEESTITLIAIDDDPVSLELISDALEQTNLQILPVTDPWKGLTLIRERRPEIVLLDLLMPSVSGMELLEKILAVSPETEVILVTGHYSTESAVEAALGSRSSPANRGVGPLCTAPPVGGPAGY
jgi:DNA-binding NtrC family response regulator